MKVFLVVLVALALVLITVASQDSSSAPQLAPTHADSVEAWRLKMLSGKWVDQGNGMTCRLFQNDIECVPLVHSE